MCTNNLGSFFCSCVTGYELSSNNLNCDGKQYSSVYVTLYINEWVKTSYLIFFSATQITNLWYGRLQSSLHIV